MTYSSWYLASAGVAYPSVAFLAWPLEGSPLHLCRLVISQRFVQSPTFTLWGLSAGYLPWFWLLFLKFPVAVPDLSSVSWHLKPVGLSLSAAGTMYVGKYTGSKAWKLKTLTRGSCDWQVWTPPANAACFFLQLSGIVGCVCSFVLSQWFERRFMLRLYFIQTLL